MKYILSITALTLVLEHRANAAPTLGERPVLPRDTLSGTPENATYDYVIIGGGTAGLAMAARLSEDSSLSVAVIEAGDYYELYGNYSEIPLYDSLWTGKDPTDTNSNIDWDFVTIPQEVCETILTQQSPSELKTSRVSRFCMVTNIF
jgi:choline dehydrogenase